ncbi:hypothetical protein [Sulfolobus acidocaldarius]|uniref:Conserved conjugative plasmid protein n=4 Tax=Sulfolobus acidocaldarius TaxID=2285 RepID=Q4JBE5_SULAC|nr:hypothetical protein [Sulfolobus acidocaldarius]AAY79884.1 conserved conjugative plasmid protein [Sulfolobus acidocaldarius DSM 639]
MSTQVVERKTPQFQGEQSSDLFLYAISSLTKEEREEIFTAFEDYFWSLIEAGELSKPAYYKLASGAIHLSDDRVLELVNDNTQAKKFLAKLLKEKAKKLLEVSAELEKEAKAEGEEE